ncbi:DUF2474 family protein [Vibrio aquaticus]|uniref:DUF2474 family protein n=1 Tax=Vibrio aquaticus TaxID=2496559 RepID=A0A3S0N3G5_9VIBR|nr:DUF2474 family protein [Vibrio aquaticus]
MKSTWRQWGWFVFLWLASIGALTVIAAVIRLALPQ